MKKQLLVLLLGSLVSATAFGVNPSELIINNFNNDELIEFIREVIDIPQLKKTLAYVITNTRKYHATSKLIRYTSGKQLSDITESDIQNNEKLRTALVLSLFHQRADMLGDEDDTNKLGRTARVEYKWLDAIKEEENKNFSTWQCNNFFGKTAFPTRCTKLQKILDDLNHKDLI